MSSELVPDEDSKRAKMMKKQIEKFGSLVDALRLLAKVHRQLRDFDGLIEMGKFNTAAGSLSELQLSNNSRVICDPAILKLIKVRAGGQADQIAKQALPTLIYSKSMELLADASLSEIIQEVLSLASISRDEAHQLKYILQLLSKSESWFVLEKGRGKSKLDKYETVIYVLESDLHDVQSEHERGLLNETSLDDQKPLSHASN
ncbi:hypothetical protein K493DRAFT_404672 [Basidiobolus meristosporus CBS 931.73]|uniref:ZW10 C-terminal helical domain-containing protein n=1 Tax=Basidiobolus meristosporus CBS 931.73 TaxID=1314790 RepID=A0A1Y1Z2G7_9FUNG|nr:hypothetical protein K493DRAFT_404672 [Basidiobolus meristosporus CBS 931.73]|eukprot:ORY04399.1 hypothetical protein K493DRAFT_404672 [Basidiobolus meristosporus CBS 931.73]